MQLYLDGCALGKNEISIAWRLDEVGIMTNNDSRKWILDYVAILKN